MVFQDFHIRISSDGEAFAISSQFLNKTVLEPLYLDPLRYVDSTNRRFSSLDDLQTVGRELFDAVLHGRVGKLYEQARGAIEADPSTGLRIRIHCDSTVRTLPFLQIPWELLFDAQRGAGEFLALNRRTPVVRSIDTTAEVLATQDDVVERVLLVIATPSNLPVFEAESEVRHLTAVLKKVGVTPTVLRHARLDTLVHYLRRRPFFQLVHFLGHGSVGPDGEGQLWLEDEYGIADPLSASKFSSLFLGIEPPRLVVLGACWSGIPGSGELRSPFTGIATALVGIGIPSVVAMSAAIRDASAKQFSKRFYEHLINNEPVEACVVEARIPLQIQSPESADWALPLVFVRDAVHVPAAAALRVTETSKNRRNNYWRHHDSRSLLSFPAPQIPDLLTPVPSSGTRMRELTQLFGEENARELGQLSDRAISAIEQGRFQEYVEIGRAIQAAGLETATTRLTNDGGSLVADGHRLLAGLNPRDRKHLLDLAKEEFAEILDLAPDDHRALRGLACCAQAEFNLGDALGSLDRAISLVRGQLALPGRLSLDSRVLGDRHELLRLIRHRIDVILRIRASSRQSNWNGEGGTHTLTQLVLEHDMLLQNTMKDFGASPEWYHFESFAGLTFLGDSWLALGDSQKGTRYALSALRHRRSAIAGQVSPIQLANLNWWSRTFSGARLDDTKLIDGVERLSDAVKKGVDDEVLREIDRILSLRSIA